MNLFVDRSIRRLFTMLVLILVAAAFASQMIVNYNAQLYKNLTLQNDYGLAGALLEGNPELADEIQAAFHAKVSGAAAERGRELLEQSGYKGTIDIRLIPEADAARVNGRIGFIILSCLLIPGILLCVYLYVSGQDKKIESYNTGIQKIMKGDTAIRLEEHEEGSLSKFAASINQLVTSLNTHIEKEVQSRIFLKDIIANISHQLRTPLTALGMYMEIMKEEKVDNEVVTGFLYKSENELERMGGLTANLLKLAKLDAGIIELNKAEHSINGIVEEAAGSLGTRMALEKKHFEIIAESSVHYLCDREWMLEAFSNLLKNAVEHTGEGCRIEAEIEAGPLMVKVIFRDNGEGIYPDDINNIFKRFYRSRHSQNKQGTGIGLTLSKSVIELHDGYITVESAPGKGTAFTIHLPILTNL
jgi:signal transduction histidine kinase